MLEASRRRFLAAVAAAGLGFAAGCTRPGAAGDAEDATPGGRDGFPRTVEHAAGRVEVPARPTRVVSALDYIDLDAVLAAGIVPVAFGFSSWLVPDVAPWAAAAGSSIRLQGRIAEISLEKIAAQGPDLIVAQAGLLGGNLDQLNGIAPTVVVDNIGGNWATPADIVGRATGREGQASTTNARSRSGVDDVRSRLAPLRGARVGVIYASGAQVGVDSIPVEKGGRAQRGAGAMLSALGLVPVDGGVDVEARMISQERLSVFADVDVLVLEDFGIGTDQLIKRPLFAGLPPVAQGRVMRLSPAATRAIYLLSSLSAPYAARELGAGMLMANQGRGTPMSVAGTR